MSTSNDHDHCMTFCTEARMDRNCIRLTSGRTDLGSYENAHTMNHANHNGALGRCSETGDDAPLLGTMASIDDDSDHCHSMKAPDEAAAAANKRATVQLSIAAAICLLFMIGEVIGGYFAGSLAIMTDAAHLLSDFASFCISLFALWVARRPATIKMSFGYYRAEVLGAVVSVLIIWIITGVLFYMAVQRCINTDLIEINADIMMITAGCGLAINLILGAVLHYSGHGHSHGGHGHSHNEYDPLSIQSDTETSITVNTVTHKQKKNVNVRAAFIHVIGDLIQSAGVFLAAIVIKVKPDWKIADPICTFVFSVLVLITTLTILRDALHVLMEGVPRDINYKSLKEDLLSIRGVVTAHGLHVWSLTTTQPALAAHLTVDNDVNTQVVLQEASQMVRKKYNIHFSTIQVEHYQPAVMDNCARCQGPC
ncbi:proton-coupled zinc antiporter SLC30A2-like [Amphiura filiformis]|uniref:proton-coupled zinc antiporter SLC30A2-like n=1 Tax=Amphiura filiformis TaxID=82378 RepID=UPI003B218F37